MTTSPIIEKHEDWMFDRDLDPVLAAKFGVYTRKNWIAVPYIEFGKVVNHKYRDPFDKSKMMMDAGAPLILCNHDCLLDPSLSSAPLIICEGEWDMFAVMGIGKRRVVSVPNGAPNKGRTDDDELRDGARYAWFWRHRELLDEVKQVILCVDNDEAGMALAADLCRLFGPERCMFVTYPDGCKDANDVLHLIGTEALVAVLEAARPYPIKGLYSMSDFPEKAPIKSTTVGISPINDMIYLVGGTVTLLTGYANMGKSTVVNAVVGSCARRGIPVCVADFESDVKPIFQDHLRAAVAEVPLNQLGRMDLTEVDALIEKNVLIITQNVDEEEEMTLEDFLELARTAVIRNGSRVVILDPWNEIEHKRRPGESETEYIARALRAIRAFAKRHNVAFWIVAHPAKPLDGVRRPPGLYDVSGSSHWSNKPDYGLVYHRPKATENEAVFYVVKVRRGLPGRKGSVKVYFDYRISNFSLVGEIGGGQGSLEQLDQMSA